MIGYTASVIGAEYGSSLFRTERDAVCAFLEDGMRLAERQRADIETPEEELAALLHCDWVSATSIEAIQDRHHQDWRDHQDDEVIEITVADVADAIERYYKEAARTVWDDKEVADDGQDG